ncbi:SMP-30/gluconolactonase/LRE family protein [Blastococcus sp. BMG 814]|uniref:SMP-30/gluconolactonase/LRE family protein n=1 Tax=Blastococcus carthaginiensis TaxID=3050034 RepID=A0ABT9I668_9ACTN|nr:SMP-30/gluconolactonase/LRE family protein [Blastococcus carthaginiensis]MDP5181056.1 SMP-30/gluconolactonase/LRE family protein [Blastococcus carthaginiensis]
MKARRLTDAVTHHGEGPVWSPAWGGLRCVDMLAGDVLTVGEDGAVVRRHVGAVAAALRPRRGGGAVIALERGFALEDPDGAVSALDPVWTDPGVRMNDGDCDPDGRFWCGSMAYDQTPGAAALYRLDPDGGVHEVVGGVTVSNGLAWSPDGSLAYYADTATHRIDVLDYDRDAGLTGRRPFVRFPVDGNPDGLTVDAEGGIWVALYGSGEVHRYDADGRRDAVVELPTPQVTACTLGGPGLDRLFVTTSAEGGLDDGVAGSLFTVDVGVRGQPARAFAG